MDACEPLGAFGPSKIQIGLLNDVLKYFLMVCLVNEEVVLVL